MSEHKFPWEPYRLIIIAHAKDDPDEVEAFVCTCADGGQYYDVPFRSGTRGIPLTLDEQGWVPMMWAPAPDFLAER